jgi:hypothetical protein
MKDIEQYYKPMMKDGVQVAWALDVLELSWDRAREIFPKSAKQREAFVRGFTEAHQLNVVMQEGNKKFEEPVKRLYVPDAPQIIR